MSRMLIVVPSRGRPESMEPLVSSFYDTSGGDADLLICQDDDDTPYSLPPHVLHEINPRLRLGGTLNDAAVRWAPKYEFIGFMGDDHRPRTQNWDVHFCEVLEKHRHAVAYGNDLIQGENLATAVFMTAQTVTDLGYMVPPGMTHLFLDNFWMELGKATNLIYLHGVIIEHMHPSVGKAFWTPQYKEVNAPEMYHEDAQKLNEYLKTFKKELEKLS